MHPLVARIHPSYRTAFFAWLFGRGLPWLAIFATSGGVAPGHDPYGGPLWAGLTAFFGLFSDTAWAGVSASIWLPAAVTEAAMFAATVAVYRFVRRDGMPQTAERATWLWAVCPAMVLAPAGSVWALAIALCAIALAAAGAGLGGWAAAFLGAAVATRPEAAIVWPGLAAMTWFRKQSEAGAWAATLGPPLVFSATIFGAVFLGFGGSLQSLQTGASWRTEIAWHGWNHHFPEIVVLAICAILLLLVVGSARRNPRTWLVIALPCLIWPFLQFPATTGAVVLLLSVPIFGSLARAAENPSVERPLLLASAATLMLLSI